MKVKCSAVKENVIEVIFKRYIIHFIKNEIVLLCYALLKNILQFFSLPTFCHSRFSFLSVFKIKQLLSLLSIVMCCCHCCSICRRQSLLLSLLLLYFVSQFLFWFLSTGGLSGLFYDQRRIAERERENEEENKRLC